jgi:hypothetical protein
MKKITIALFTVVALTSCGGDEKCESRSADSTVVSPVVTDSLSIDESSEINTVIRD